MEVPANVVGRLHDLQDRDFVKDEEVRKGVIEELGNLWVEIGKFVESQQADFNERDVQKDAKNVTVALPEVSARPSVAHEAPPSPPTTMHDDEAKVLLASWLGGVARLSQDYQADSPGLMSPTEIAANARVPESKVELLLTVARENDHLGVTVKQLQGGKFHLDVGPPRVRRTREDPWE
jgi:hypothetical protein